MVAVTIVALVVGLSGYWAIVDAKGHEAIGPDFWTGWGLMAVCIVVIGLSAVTSVPRNLGKASSKLVPTPPTPLMSTNTPQTILKYAAWHLEPGASYQHQVLAATIATMVGIDANYR